MSEAGALPPGIGINDSVVLFDGVCRLCAAWSRFLIRFDKRYRFRLATVQSEQGQAILTWFGLPRDEYETMVLVENGRLYTKSAAFIRVVRRLPMPWPLLALGWCIPGFIRDWLYDRIALNRYQLFGKYDICMVPDPDHKERFLGSE